MNQAIALRAQYRPIDYAGAVQDGQLLRAGDIKMQNAQKRSDLESMELDDAMGQQSALKGYRQAAKKGDSVSALEELEAYPEMQTKIFETLDGMPVKERIKAKKRSEAFGRTAKWVLGYPEGSPERQKAWETSLNVLRRDGYLDEEMYRMGMENGPSDMLLNEYLTADEFMKQYDPVKRAQVRNIENQVTNRDANTANQIANRNKNTESQISVREGKDKEGKPVAGGKGNDATRRAAVREYYSELDRRKIEPNTPEAAALEDEVFSKYGLTGAKSGGAIMRSEFTNPSPVTQTDLMMGGTGGAAPGDVAASPQSPPAPAIQYLRDNPQLADQFDQKYGPGAAAAVLGE